MYLRLVGILKPEVSPLAMGPLESVSHPLKPSLPTPSMLVQATQPTTAALKKKKIIYIWLCWVFIAALAFSSCGKRGLLYSRGLQASSCAGVFYC